MYKRPTEGQIQAKPLQIRGKKLELAGEKPPSTLPPDETGQRKPDLLEPIMEDGVQRLLLVEGTRKHNVRLRRIQIELENHDLIQFRKGRRHTAVEHDELGDEMMQDQQEEYMRQNREDVSRRKLQKLCEAEGWGEQVKEKELLKHKERLEKLRDVEICDDLILQEQELQQQAAKEKVESKRRNLKSQLEEIGTRRRNREMHMGTVKMEEEKAKREQRQDRERMLQNKRKQSELFRKRQIPTQIASDLLAKSKEERASAAALKEEQAYLRAVAQREAEYAEQQKKKEEKEAAARPRAIANYSCCMRNKEEQRQAKHENAVEEMQAQMEADRLAVEEDRLKAQRTRENNIRCQDFNLSTAAGKQLLSEQQRDEELDFEVRKAEEKVLKETQLQQQAQQELHEAKEKLRRKRRQDVQPESSQSPPTSGSARQPGEFMTQPQDTNRVIQNNESTAVCLPPIQLVKKNHI